MRIGDHPLKANPALGGYGLHRLIMPVFIPNTEGYFAEAIEVLRLCLESLRLTRKPATAVTIAANGCCQAARAVLQGEMEAGWIDQLTLHARNRGKVDAIMGAARGCFEPIVTFADCDVLFRRGWDSAIENLFAVFPECGFVSPFCVPGSEMGFTSAAILAGMAGRTIRFEAIANPSDVAAFARSIGHPERFQGVERLGQFVLRREGVSAGIGGGHFVCSLRRPVIQAAPAGPAMQAICGDSETNWLDLPPDRLGYWRLMTDRACVQHLGNRLEPWMAQELAALRRAPPPADTQPMALRPMRRHWTALVPYPIRVRLADFLGRRLRERCRRRAGSLAATPRASPASGARG
jgi:hypothetical protein